MLSLFSLTLIDSYGAQYLALGLVRMHLLAVR